MKKGYSFLGGTAALDRESSRPLSNLQQHRIDIAGDKRPPRWIGGAV
jgi:hypothetical protein